MRITHRMIADSVNLNLQRSLTRLEFYSSQMSTGKKFQRASENPVGVGRVMSYSAAVNRNEQFRLNMNQTSGWLDNTEFALQNGLDVLQRIRELSIYGANESLTAEDRRAIAPEVVEFIDHLLGIANTETNGLYIFGGHQTLKAPFIRENIYGVKVNYLEESHVGYAEFDAGAVLAGTAGRSIGLTFSVDGIKYSVTAVSDGIDPAETFNNIEQAVANHTKLSKLINVGGDETAMTFTRLTPGDFSVTATTPEAETVITNLTGTPVNVLASEQNIFSLGGLSPNSFLAGDYKVLTGDTALPYTVNAGTRVFEYSQSKETLVNSITATAATQNQSVSFVVTAIDGNDVTLSYEYSEMDPADGAVITNTGFITLDKSLGAAARAIGNVTYDLDLNDVKFTLGDRVVVNTNAAVLADADLVHLHRDDAVLPLFTFAFIDDALLSDTHSFNFYSLDTQSGALLKSSLDLQWGADFETTDTFEKPAAGFVIRVNDGNGNFVTEKTQVLAEGMQNGSYHLDQTGITADGDHDSEVIITQQSLQGSALSLFTGSSGDIDAVTLTGSSAVNASLLMEITGIDNLTGQVTYAYTAHEYDLDGNYEKKTGNIILEFGGAAVQTKLIGSFSIDFEGLETLDASNLSGLQVGDRAVINVRPDMADTVSYDRLTLSGDYRSESSEVGYIFNEGALDGKDINLWFFSLDNFERSLDKGQVYDGYLNINDDTLELLRLPGNQHFAFDSLGFPVYYGDNHDRIQEISPHQEMIMNVSGTKAFGMNQEIFDAAFEVYWALIDNDRETLGDSALKKMDQAIGHFLERLAEVGARSNRVEAMHTTLFSENLYLREVRSNIEDIDLAYVITEFTMQENAYKAALSTASMMLQPSLVDYMR